MSLLLKSFRYALIGAGLIISTAVMASKPMTVTVINQISQESLIQSTKNPKTTAVVSVDTKRLGDNAKTFDASGRAVFNLDLNQDWYLFPILVVMPSGKRDYLTRFYICKDHRNGDFLNSDNRYKDKKSITVTFQSLSSNLDQVLNDADATCSVTTSSESNANANHMTFAAISDLGPLEARSAVDILSNGE